MNWYLNVLKEYANFTGRARREEYWMFFLFNFLAAAIAMIAGIFLGMGASTYSLYALATVVPSLAVFVRRLHDTGKSGWFFLIIFVPIVGIIWLLVILTTDSEVGENNWGPNPKGEVNNNAIDKIGTE